MSSATTTDPGRVTTGDNGRSLRRRVTAGAVIATVANTILWSAGRAAGVSFAVPGSLVPEVDLWSVVLTTPIMFALGFGLLVLAARRGRAGALLVTAALFALVSAVAPLASAGDAATGVLLAAMHLLTGAAFVVTGSSARIRT
jgi:hypothetical protein